MIVPILCLCICAGFAGIFVGVYGAMRERDEYLQEFVLALIVYWLVAFVSGVTLASVSQTTETLAVITGVLVAVAYAGSYFAVRQTICNLELKAQRKIINNIPSLI